MARTRRSRQAAPEDANPVPAPAKAPSTADSNNNDDQVPTRGRARATRSRNSLAARDASAAAEPSAAPNANDTVSSIEIGRRALETPSLRRDTTGLDLADDSVFGDLGDSFADGDIPAAPRSADTTRSWSNFKTRSRQSSIIGRNDPPIRPSSRGGNTPGISSSFNIGVFRRRAREPSILGSRKPRSETSGRGAQSELESEGEGDFAPEAESTPLNNRRRTRASLAAEQQEASRDVSSATERSRKRKSGEELASGRASKSTRRATEHEEESESESEVSELASPQLGPSALPRPVTPVNMDEINAPPASSGSEDEGNPWPDIHTLAKRRRRPSISTPLRGGDNLSDISSPPSLTHSPNFAETRSGRRGRSTAARKQDAAVITSADLANLLPKRRYKKTHDDEESDDEGAEADDDEDEPSHARTRSARRGGSRTPSRAASRRATPTSGRGRRANALQPKTTPVSTRRTRSATNKTYSRRSSDKENQSDDEADDSQFQPLDDDTFDATSAIDFQSVEELKNATRKFMEVDKWELEYEEVAESFSPKGAR